MNSQRHSCLYPPTLIWTCCCRYQYITLFLELPFTSFLCLVSCLFYLCFVLCCLLLSVAWACPSVVSYERVDRKSFLKYFTHLKLPLLQPHALWVVWMYMEFQVGNPLLSRSLKVSCLLASKFSVLCWELQCHFYLHSSVCDLWSPLPSLLPPTPLLGFAIFNLVIL